MHHQSLFILQGIYSSRVTKFYIMKTIILLKPILSNVLNVVYTLILLALSAFEISVLF